MRTNPLAGLACVGLLAISAGCGEDLEPNVPDEIDDGGSRILHLEEKDGIRLTRVDARSEEAWTHLDLETGKEVQASDPAWDLAFQRMAVISNGGVSGDAGTAVVVLDGMTFDAATGVPDGGFVEDAADGEDEDAYADSAFGGMDPWYSYDLATHTLKPQARVFVVRTAEGRHFKIAFTGYYDDAGTSGYPAFRWSEVEPGGTTVGKIEHLDETAGVTSTRVDARDGESWVYLDLENGAETAATDGGWDLAFQRMAVISNGGASGDGGAAVAMLDGLRFDEVSEAPVDGYVEDGADHASAFGGEDPWYDYNPSTHMLTPKVRVHVVRTGDGGHFKLEITDYYDDEGTGGFVTFRWAAIGTGVVTEGRVEHLSVEEGVTTTRVHATSEDGAVFLDLDEGVEVSEGAGWDLSFTGFQIHTNGGERGEGGVAVAMIDGVTLEDVASVPAEGWVEDGPSGSAFNVEGDAWYTYDPSTHEMGVRLRVYVVRSSEGAHYAVQMTSFYDDEGTPGFTTFRWAPLAD